MYATHNNALYIAGICYCNGQGNQGLSITVCGYGFLKYDIT